MKHAHECYTFWPTPNSGDDTDLDEYDDQVESDHDLDLGEETCQMNPCSSDSDPSKDCVPLTINV